MYALSIDIYRRCVETWINLTPPIFVLYKLNSRSSTILEEPFIWPLSVYLYYNGCGNCGIALWSGFLDGIIWYSFMSVSSGLSHIFCVCSLVVFISASQLYPCSATLLLYQRNPTLRNVCVGWSVVDVLKFRLF